MEDYKGLINIILIPMLHHYFLSYSLAGNEHSEIIKKEPV